MKFYQFIRIYTGYGLVYISYKTSVFILNKLFDMVDEVVDSETEVVDSKTEVIDSETNVSNNNDGFIETYKKKPRGGDNGLILKTGNVLSKALDHVKRFSDTSISKIIKPIASTIGYLLLKFPALNKIYRAVKNLKQIIASVMALTTIRIVARFDYWALILCDGLPKTDIGDKIMLSSIRRMRMGMNHLEICIPRTEQIINLVNDQKIDSEEKDKILIDLFTLYEQFPEGHLFKNSYFVCIVHMLLTLFISNKSCFKFALKILARMLRDGKISLATYFEIISQLLVTGVPPVEVDL